MLMTAELDDSLHDSGAPQRDRVTPPVMLRCAQFQLSILMSFGFGAPFPVSTSDFKLIRKTAHLVLQWCMNSTGSFQPWCLNSTME